MLKVQEHISKAELPITSVGLKPINFGNSIHLDLPRGPLTMAMQILTGLEAMDCDYAYLCEHDVLYSSEHFLGALPKEDTYLYNVNVYKINMQDGYGLKVDDCRQLSGLYAHRKTLLTHFKERIKRIKAGGFSRRIGFEPGTHNRRERIDDLKSEVWSSTVPILDLRHGANLTSSRWSPDEFRNKKYTEGWTETKDIKGWGLVSDIIKELT